MQTKGFPLPFRLADNVLAWDEREVDDWIEAQPRGFGARPDRALARRAELHARKAESTPA